jgi:hypothetical protein
MSTFENKIIRSWDQFSKFVLRLNAEDHWIYRGQAQDWPLSTTLERALGNWKIEQREAISIEFQTIREFRRRMREPQNHRVHNDLLFCLALMQHHGAPTRLLDCTYSAFVAAAFAMEKGYVRARGKNTNPVVWCFRGVWCEEEAKEAIAPDDLLEERNEDCRRNDDTFISLYQLGPAATDPRKRRFVKPENPLHLNERLTTQQGVFLCPGNLGVSFEQNLQAMRGSDLPRNVVKLKLILKNRKAIEFDSRLKNMNLSFAALFPGLEGFARSIEQQILHYRKLADERTGLPRMGKNKGSARRVNTSK